MAKKSTDPFKIWSIFQLWHFFKVAQSYPHGPKLAQLTVPIRDVAKGRRRGRPAWGFRAHAGRRPARAKTPAEATETLTEVTSGQSGPLRPSEPARKTGPLWLSSQSHHQRSFWISGALPTVRGPLKTRGSNGMFQAWGPLKFRHFIFNLPFFVNLGPFRKIVGQIRGLFNFG